MTKVATCLLCLQKFYFYIHTKGKEFSSHSVHTGKHTTVVQHNDHYFVTEGWRGVQVVVVVGGKV